MDDEKSGVAVDYSGYDNYGTLVNGPAFVEGYLGDALSFDGVDDYVNCGNDASLTSVDSVSVTAWIKMSATGRDQKIASNQNGSTGGYKLGVYSGNSQVEFEIRTAANTAILNRTATGGVVPDRDVWYHVVGVYDKGKALRTYVNGKLDRELATTEVAGISTGALMLGRESYSSAYYWLGLMDDVRVYNKALTEPEIQKVMQGDPLLAWAPQPATGATLDIRAATDLSWSAGQTAAGHDVYLGRDKDAVQSAEHDLAAVPGPPGGHELARWPDSSSSAAAATSGGSMRSRPTTSRSTRVSSGPSPSPRICSSMTSKATTTRTTASTTPGSTATPTAGATPSWATGRPRSPSERSSTAASSRCRWTTTTSRRPTSARRRWSWRPSRTGRATA